MTLLVPSVIWVLLVAGLLARAINQYRHYEIIGDSDGGTPADSVTVIVPARNEARNIEKCLDGLVAQDYPRSQLCIIVVDDGSEDGTGEIVLRVARNDGRVRLIEGSALPEGWLGKPHACWQGAENGDGDWLCFIDADTKAESPLIRTAVNVARSRQLDLLSLQPFQELVSPWERLILPAGFFFIAFTQDLRRTNDPGLPDASVNGQFLLIRRAAYEQVGGHAAVRDAVGEDSALAGLLKRSGHPISVLGTEGLLRTRMYSSFHPLWEGMARQAALLLPSAAALLVVALAALVLAWAPVTLLVWGGLGLARGTAPAVAGFALALLGSLALLGTHIGAARYFRIPFGYGLLFPLAYTLGAGIALYTVVQLGRRQVRWKGRVYRAAGAQAVAPDEAGVG